VCGEVHLLLVSNVVERLPIMVRDKLQSQDALDARSDKHSQPGVIQLAEHEKVPDEVNS